MMTTNNQVYKDIGFLKKCQNNIILFGEVGSGKTTLINKLCNKNFETREGGYSCTKDVQYANTFDGSIIIDFPGLNASEDITTHLNIQKLVLSAIPVRMICFVLKANTRIDNILKLTFQMMKIFYKNINNVVFILTFSENLTTKMKAEIKFHLNSKFKIDENSVIFSGKNVNVVDLNQKLSSLKNKLSIISFLDVKEKNLLNSELDAEIIEFKEKKLTEIQNFILSYKKKYNNSLSANLKLGVYYTFKYYSENIIKAYREKLYKKIPDIDNINAELIVFSNEINYSLDQIIQNQQTAIIHEYCKFGKLSLECQKGLSITEKLIKGKVFFGQFSNFEVIMMTENYIIAIKEYNQSNNINLQYNKKNNIDNNFDYKSKFIRVNQPQKRNLTKNPTIQKQRFQFINKYDDSSNDLSIEKISKIISIFSGNNAKLE